MTPDIHRQAIDVLSEVWALAPDVRLGQLMAHLGLMGDVYFGHGLGNLEDDELLSVLHRHRDELVARTSGSTVSDMVPDR